MRQRYRFVGMSMAMMLALFLLSTTTSFAQLGAQFLPTLSLQKKVATPATTAGDVTSGDTIYVSEPGAGEKRYLVMPVFALNCLDSLTSENVSGFSGKRIFSFSFQIQYNACMLRAVGVSKRGSLPLDTAILAKNFNFSWERVAEPQYKFPTTGGTSAFGERITVTASSSLPLPRSPYPNGTPNPICSDRQYMPLVYVIFEVVGDAQGGTCGITSDQTILVRDSIRWNNWRPANVTPEMINSGFSPVQVGVFPVPIFPITFPNNYGSTIVQITRRPRIDLLPPSQVVTTVPLDYTNYQLTTPMQTQFGNLNPVYRQLQLVNGVASTYLRNVIVETDEPWLRIDTTDTENTSAQLGQGGYNGERGVVIRQFGAQLKFNLVANPTMLPKPPNGYPTPGIYEGYVTIRSVDAQNSSVRLKVQLIVNRNPLEPTLRDNTEPTNTRGIMLTFRNSANLPDTTYLTFGTGVGATDGVDTLFGELEATTPANPNSFYARFYPPSLSGFNGLIDARGLYTTGTSVPKATNNEASLDIRNYDVETIHTYCVNFGAGAPANYPIVIEYDTNDIPQGAQLFFRQNVSGLGSSINMRTQGAIIGSSKRAIFINDPSVRSFCIDYLLPRVVQFPEINRGWNFVSLPVDPSDPRADNVFPNSSSGAIRFTQNQYSKADTVRPGIGYFVKYGAIKDLTISGTPVMLIHELLTPHRVRLFEGWNTVGALSVPTDISQISFGSYQNTTPPTRTSEVYRYVTSRGYEQVSRIIPGYGYWLKVSGDGWYRLQPLPKAMPTPGEARPYQTLNNLRIADNQQYENSQLWFGYGTMNTSRYELPPAPGTDMFDVRFNNNGFVSASVEREASHVVNLSGMTYPVTLTVDNPEATYVVTDAATGAYIGQFEAGQATAVRIENGLTKAVKLTRIPSASVELGAAYPNPTSDKMFFDIAVPQAQQVTVALYNAIGEKVAELYNGQVENAESVEFSTRGLNPGVYLYRMTTASGETQVRQIVVTK